VDDELFPASEQTPGQDVSRAQYATVREQLQRYAWYATYLELRAEELTLADGRKRKLDWRKAVYVAWASTPARDRQPATQEELATRILGLRSAHTISAWKRDFPDLETLIIKQQAAPLFNHRADIYDALVQVASMVDPKAAADRKLALELLGDYKPRKALEVSGEDGEPLEVIRFDVSELSAETLRRLADAEESDAATD